MYLCTKFRHLSLINNPTFGIFCESVGWDKGGLSPSFKDGCSTKSWGESQPDPKHRETSNPRHFFKLLDTFNLRINQVPPLITHVFDLWPKTSPKWCLTVSAEPLEYFHCYNVTITTSGNKWLNCKQIQIFRVLS